MMAIRYNQETNIFQINTKNTTYMMGVFAEKYLRHLYYGKRIEDMNCRYLMGDDKSEGALRGLKLTGQHFFETSWFEYPTQGTGDYRDNCLCVRDEYGHRVCELHFEGYQIFNGKPEISGMPATFECENEGANAETLEITLKDQLLGLKILLRYSIFEDSDAIIRSVVAINAGEKKLYLEKILSTCVDMDNKGYELTTLHGTWGRERHIVTKDITIGKYITDSVEGRTSHAAQPFMMLASKGATQKYGNVYGMNLIYSGNFIAETEVNFQESVRMTLGIHPDGFEWVLSPGETFETPEAVMIYSADGIGKMTREFHDLYRNHLIRSKYLHEKRPILINNWEATYFDFDDDKLLSIAKEAKKCGIEMLVMDDGWFGNRNDDVCALGDWQVNENKIKGGLKSLVERINAEGMKFGIWFEPEAISPDSELYRLHPDWAIQVPGREGAMWRAQYVLDITRDEIADYIYECMAKLLRSCNIEYIKWDMNRPLTDIGSYALDREHMGEFFHRYVLALYRMQERLMQEFPNVLLENCCSGGGRFDAGMLYYSPQIWTSDDMDPVERLYIQEGTALIYPLSTMGAHVCVCPNHSTGRNIPFETRANVAMTGTFGYELDITKLSEEEKMQTIKYNNIYHKYNDIYREGDYYRIASFRENQVYDCWQVVNKDKTECLVTYVQGNYITRGGKLRLLLEGLDPEAKYQLQGTEEVYTGEILMNVGYLQRMIMGDYNSKILHFVQV